MIEARRDIRKGSTPFLYLLLLANVGLSIEMPHMATWEGLLRDASGNPVHGAVLSLTMTRSSAEQSHQTQLSSPTFESTTNQHGAFSFQDLPATGYQLSVRWKGSTIVLKGMVEVREGERSRVRLQISADQKALVLSDASTPETNVSAKTAVREAGTDGGQASGGEQLSSRQVSGLPLNKRDFTQFLQLASGTTTDTNGAANFTQQFAVNGQRGSTAVFAMDGVDTTDPELGGASFSNFNVEAIQEIRSDSGVMPATVGEGAAAFTNVITKSGTDLIHGSVFEFARNAAFDARNFFDRRSIVNPGRIPPFVRNEFGFTNGGPVLLPGLYDGRRRTYYFAQYQGFRQVLGTTQVLSVPTSAERQGFDTTAVPGDTLLVPVDPEISPVLARFPLPNDPLGPYGSRTFATSSKVDTSSKQFSIRVDHRISDRANLMARFNLDNVSGPSTNPDQIAIDPSFGIRFRDHQRNIGLTYTRHISSNLTSESLIGYIRTTPAFLSTNTTQPGLVFGDGLYEPYNLDSGSNFGVWSNLFQFRQSLAWVRKSHTFKMGFESRFNRDSTIYAFSANGTYTFGGGPAYSAVTIPSASGQHDIRSGDPLPDSLTGFLTGTPHAFVASIPGAHFPSGDKTGLCALHRAAYDAYFEDAWNVSPKLNLSYGMRYEVNTPFQEPHHLSTGVDFVGADGRPSTAWQPGVRERLIVYPNPIFPRDWRGLGPRLSLDWQATGHTTLRAAAGITTRLPTMGIDDAATASIPFLINPYFTATAGAPVPFNNAVVVFNPPELYTPAGQAVFATGRSTDVRANTVVDLVHFEDDLAALSPGHQPQALLLYATGNRFKQGYIETFTAGFNHQFGEVTLNTSYVGTAGVHLPALDFPNGYGGASPGFAPFTTFSPSGRAVSGFGPEYVVDSPVHSTYHAFSTSLSKTSSRFGLGFQASYTFSKSLDTASSAVAGLGLTPSVGTVIQAPPQDPRNRGAEKGPSTFDVTHIGSFEFIQVLPFNRLSYLKPLGHRFTSGWQLLDISVLTNGSPFSVFSGVQQTGLGTIGADRPDQIGQPQFSTSRKVREDYFGLGANNVSFFSVPIGLPDGTGPNSGRVGTLGRNTFRGPAFHNFDVALTKDTPFLGQRGSEPLTLQFRAEFFNVFNLVDFGLPSNIVRGSGFGIINRTAGPSRQLQFSLKLLY